MCKPPLIRFAFVRFILFRTFSVIFILNIRHGGTSETMNSLFISWTSHPSEVLSEPPPLLESVAGRKYHYPPAFHRPSRKLFRILKLHICRSLFQGLGVWLLWLPRFYTDRRIDVFPMLIFCFQDALELFFHLYRGRSRTFDTPKSITFLKVCEDCPKYAFSFCVYFSDLYHNVQHTHARSFLYSKAFQ